MKKNIISIVGLLGITGSLFANTPKIDAAIYRMAIFKNGISVVSRHATLDKNQKSATFANKLQLLDGGVYISNPTISILSKLEKEFVETQVNTNDYTKLFKDQEVTITVSGTNSSTKTMVGKFVQLPTLNNQQKANFYIPSSMIAFQEKDSKLINYFAPHRIVDVQSSALPQLEMQKTETFKPVLVFSKNSDNEESFDFSYLSKGVQWTPSYKLELNSKDKLTLTYDAVIKNDLEDFNDVEIILVSGYPNMKYANNPSLLNLSYNPVPMRTVNNLYANQMAMEDSYSPVILREKKEYSAITEASGSSDILYKSVGKKSLNNNSAIFFNVEQAKDVDYERIVNWNIPPMFNKNGSSQYNNGNNDMRLTAYDAIKFNNPFDDAISRSPISIFDGNKFLSQSEIKWVNPKQSATIEITKALSIDTNVTEYIIEKSRVNDFNFFGYRYYKVDVESKIKAKNYRPQNSKVLINFNFYGTFIESTDNPNVNVLANTQTNINPLNQANYVVDLKNNEEKIIKLKYSIYYRY